ncbi:MAG: hypothetical protein KKA19_06855 [Candidatus Margulisbacteria bacterium]|nr:hypothetical protein [Candidatus Margulisiibacteriota bacterium]
MKILFKENALSLIKAVFYSEFTGGEILSQKNFNPSLFAEPIIEADDLDIEELILKLRQLKKHPKLFSYPKHLQDLEKLISLVLLHTHLHCLSTIIKVLRQAINKDCLFVLKGLSKEAQQLLDWAKEVEGEVRLSLFKIKFHVMPDSPDILYAKYSLKFNTYALVLKQWIKIYPEFTFLLLLPNKTIVSNRFGSQEFAAFYGKLSSLAKKISGVNLARLSQRSNLISSHMNYVSDTADFPILSGYKNPMNYVAFYNKIKERKNLL